MRKALVLRLRALAGSSAREELPVELAAGVLLQSGRWSATLSSVEGLRRPNPQLLLVTGAAYLERSRREEMPRDPLRALDVLVRATRATPDSPAAWFDRGLAAAQLHLCRTAQASFRAALEHESDHGWRRETQHRLRSTACQPERQPTPALTSAEEVAWERLGLDRLFASGRLEEIVQRAGREAGREEHGHAFRGQLAWFRGTAEMGLGRPGNALHSFATARDHFVAAGDEPRQGAVHSLLASAHSVVGDTHRSWQHRRLALDLLQRTGWRERLDVALGALAYDAFEEGLPSAALVVLEEIQPPADAPEERRATNGLYRARALAAIGDAAAAEDLLRELAPSRHTGGGVSSVQDGTLRLREGETLRLLRRHQEALAALTGAADVLSARGEALPYAEALVERAEVHLALGDPQATRQDLRLAQVHLERQRASLDLLRRPALVDLTDRIAELAIRVELALGSPAGALRELEAAAARSLAERVGVAVAEGLPASEPARPGDPLRRQDPLTLRYGVLDDELLVWSLAAGESTLHRLPIRKDELRKLVLSAAAAVERGDTAEAALARLGEILLGSLGDGASPQRLVVVPDDVLYALPFAALRPPGWSGPLIERVEVRIVPSLALASGSPLRGPAAESLGSLWVADAEGLDQQRLPAARQSAIEAAASYHSLGGATLLLGADATVDAVTTALQQASLVELDVHSTSTASFLGSQLHLTPGAADPTGVIAADALAALELPALRLVVLASCDSANSRYRGSEGLGGLQWAFLAAGAEAVVATLWAVEDRESARFTTRLHAHLRRGRRLSAAMRDAALESMAAGDPWAAFVHYGGDPLLVRPTP